MAQDFSRSIWDQLTSRTPKEIIAALLRDDWTEEDKRGATRSFVKEITNGVAGRRRRIVIHYHPKKTYGRGLMKKLIEDTGWMIDDLARLKLIKKPRGKRRR